MEKIKPFTPHSIRDNTLFFRKYNSIKNLEKNSESRLTTSLHLTRNTNSITKVSRKRDQGQK